MRRLVSKAELLWVVDAMSPASTGTIADVLPLDHNSVYVRLRHLARSGFLEATPPEEAPDNSYRWALTDAGRDRLAGADLPDVTTVDFETYFANRAMTIDPVMILEALSVEEGTWHTSGTVYDALPFSKAGIRNRLHELQEEGAVELDPGENGLAHRWRLTDAGRERLASADTAESDTREYQWLSS